MRGTTRWSTTRMRWCILHFWIVSAWEGELRMLEGQTFSWQQLPVDLQPILPGTIPVLAWFAQERGFQGPTHGLSSPVN